MVALASIQTVHLRNLETDEPYSLQLSRPLLTSSCGLSLRFFSNLPMHSGLDSPYAPIRTKREHRVNGERLMGRRKGELTAGVIDRGCHTRGTELKTHRPHPEFPTDGADPLRMKPLTKSMFRTRRREAPSRRMAAGSVSLVAVLRDARNPSRRAPQVGHARLRMTCALLRTRSIDATVGLYAFILRVNQTSACRGEHAVELLS